MRVGTHPFGLTFLTDYEHFRPMLVQRQHMHEAEAAGIGKDRSTPSLTGSWQHYPPAVAAHYRDPALCPEDLLLFFHHLPSQHRLAGGRALAEAFRTGVDAYPRTVASWQTDWAALAVHMDSARHAAVAERLAAQYAEAMLWQDTLLDYFFRPTLASV